MSELLKSGLAAASRLRGGTDWDSISRLLGSVASTVVIGCQERGASVLKSLLSSNTSSSTRQIVACLTYRLCKAVPSRRGCVRWLDLPDPFSGAPLKISTKNATERISVLIYLLITGAFRCSRDTFGSAGPQDTGTYRSLYSFPEKYENSPEDVENLIVLAWDRGYASAATSSRSVTNLRFWSCCRRRHSD